MATFTDADPAGAAGDFTATIVWGDTTIASTGTVATSGDGTFTVAGSHTYAEEGTGLPVTVAIHDAAGAMATAASTANVADAVLTSALGATFAPTEGVVFSGQVAMFTATDPQASAGTFTVNINWGDGSVSASTVSAAGGSNFSVIGSHSYAEDGASQPVTITDPGGASATAHGTANVADAVLATASGATIAATEGVAFSGRVTTFTDADPAGAVGDYTATIVWATRPSRPPAR